MSDFGRLARIVGAALVALGCSGTPARVATARHAPVARAETTPADFGAATRRRMDQVSTRVDRAVRRGDMAPIARDEVRMRRAYVERMLATYAADGVIRESERRHIDALVDALQRTAERYHDRAAVGGGPARAGGR